MKDGFGGLVVNMLASGTRVPGFNPQAGPSSEGKQNMCSMSQLCGM